MIDPDIWASEEFAGVTRDARLLCVGMFSNADDYGRIKVTPMWLKMNIFPGDSIEDSTVLAWRGELEQAKDEAGKALLALYESSGKVYGFLPGFEKTQHRYKKFEAKYPHPPLEWLPPLSDFEKKELGVGGTSTTPPIEHSDTPTAPERQPVARNRNRKDEGKGKDERKDLEPPVQNDIPRQVPTCAPPVAPDSSGVHNEDGTIGEGDAATRLTAQFMALTTREPVPYTQRKEGPGIMSDLRVLVDEHSEEAVSDAFDTVIKPVLNTSDAVKTLKQATYLAKEHLNGNTSEGHQDRVKAILKGRGIATE